jgi:hypothetical protein
MRPYDFDSSPDQLLAVGNTLYFTADDGIHGRELWKVVVDAAHQPGDTDGDNDVDLEDLNNVRNHFGAVGENLVGDANRDGRVDLADLNDVRNNFGASAGTTAAFRELDRKPTSSLGQKPSESVEAGVLAKRESSVGLRPTFTDALFDELGRSQPFGKRHFVTRGGKAKSVG